MSTVDAAFTKAVATIKSLTKGPTAIGIPPSERRHLLYGLFKQAMEGDVEGIMPRPQSGSDPASRGAVAKWEAWKSQEGLSKQQAKLEYVRCLLETMRALRPPELTDPLPTSWIELENSYQQAKSTMDAIPAEDQRQPTAAASPRYHRRLSIGSTASTYSHFLRPKPNIPRGTYSEFGLSEKDRSEIQADQLVDRMQRAYPPILPGAVIPQSLPANYPPTTSTNLDEDCAAPSSSVHLPFTSPPSSPASPSILSQVLEVLRTAMDGVQRHIATGVNRILYSLTVDVLKLVAVLTVIRLVASKPEMMKRLPISKRILAALGKLLAVLLDEIGIEIKLKPPRNSNRRL